MEHVKYSDFKLKIADDFNVPFKREFKLKLPKDKKSMKLFTNGVAREVRIFDGIREYPYMLDLTKRNDEMLIKGVELRHLGEKSLNEILKETGAIIKSKKCKVDEGQGCYSNGTKYSYKNIYCEV